MMVSLGGMNPNSVRPIGNTGQSLGEVRWDFWNYPAPCSNTLNAGGVTEAGCAAWNGFTDFLSTGWGAPGYANAGTTLTPPPVQQPPNEALTNPNSGNLDGQAAERWKEQWAAWGKTAFGTPNAGSGGYGDGALLSSLIGILLVAGIAMYFLQRNR